MRKLDNLNHITNRNTISLPWYRSWEMKVVCAIWIENELDRVHYVLKRVH